ncbi:MAG: hypothetical protein PHI29_01580 [Gallionella sp.]|nr:hypothetical protein [Gallionella sp.]
MIKDTDTPMMITRKLQMLTFFSVLSALFALAGAGIYSIILGMISGLIVIYYLHKKGILDLAKDFKEESEKEISE